MKPNRRSIAFVLTGLFLLSLLASCSDKGVHMPKHRKRTHCDCPTFAKVESGEWETEATGLRG